MLGIGHYLVTIVRAPGANKSARPNRNSELGLEPRESYATTRMTSALISKQQSSIRTDYQDVQRLDGGGQRESLSTSK